MIVKEVDDSIRPFIEEKMIAYDSAIYTKEDFALFFANPHKNVVFYDKNGEILAFACITHYVNGYRMCYTYSSNNGKRTYAKGIDYMVENYSPMYFSDGALKINKIRRLVNDTKPN